MASFNDCAVTSGIGLTLTTPPERMMADEKNIYVAVDTDGFLAGAVVNDPEYKKDVAKDVALFIKCLCL